MRLVAKAFAVPRHIAAWLQPQDFLMVPDAACGKNVIGIAARFVAAAHGLSAALVFDALWRRELAGSTGMGHGVAVPHARIAGIARPLTLYLRTAVPLPFDAPDDRPVADFLAILVPSDGDNEDHLQLLAAVAGLFSDRRFRNGLHRAETPAAAAGVFRSAIERLVDHAVSNATS